MASGITIETSIQNMDNISMSALSELEAKLIRMGVADGTRCSVCDTLLTRIGALSKDGMLLDPSATLSCGNRYD